MHMKTLQRSTEFSFNEGPHRFTLRNMTAMAMATARAPRVENYSGDMSEQFSITRAVSSEEGIYGLILVSGLIATSGSAGASALHTLIFTAVTVIVFWLAHLYAGVVAAHGSVRPDGTIQGLRASIRHAVQRSRGLLASALLPAIALLLGTLGVLEDTTAIWISLWIVVGVLALLGYLAYQRKGAKLHMCLIGAVTTASFGIVIIIAKAIITH